MSISISAASRSPFPGINRSIRCSASSACRSCSPRGGGRRGPNLLGDPRAGGGDPAERRHWHQSALALRLLRPARYWLPLLLADPARLGLENRTRGGQRDDDGGVLSHAVRRQQRDWLAWR